MGYRPPYSDEFKQRAVRLVTEMGMTPAQAAQDLGCSAQAIRDWRKQAAIDAGERDGITSDERERLQTENAELKRRNEQLEQDTSRCSCRTCRSSWPTRAPSRPTHRRSQRSPRRSCSCGARKPCTAPSSPTRSSTSPSTLPTRTSANRCRGLGTLPRCSHPGPSPRNWSPSSNRSGNRPDRARSSAGGSPTSVTEVSASASPSPGGGCMIIVSPTVQSGPQ
ncbi:transposase [Egibacter rhizosphaerae]|uniref:Transposase n=1 Tax=Egibacter rhizosphaerae TaxID=1670831 RepID=A0A411YBD5_9ACTN|nr:transposase [Egibacter rhizosphaerae]